MKLFQKKVKLLDTGSKAELERKENLLKAAGIWTNTWETNPFPVLGGAHMKAGDWSGPRPENKDDERIVHHLEVLKADQYEAMKILMEDGGVELSEE